MSLVVLFAASLFVTQTPPPLIEAPTATLDASGPPPTPAPEPTMSTPPLPPAAPGPSAPPPPPAASTSKAPLWEAGVWATATLPTSLSGSAFMFGARAELDIWRIGVVGTFDRVGVTPFSIGFVF